MGSGNGNLVDGINFPPYCVEILTDRHFVVGGGDGPTRSGVKNGFVCSAQKM